MNEQILSLAVDLFDIPVQPLSAVRGGNVNKVYVFTRAGQAYGLRLTPPNPEIGRSAQLSDRVGYNEN